MDTILSLRQATIKDAQFLLELRNDQETRKNSYNTGLIDGNEHMAWLESTIGNPFRKLFVAEENGIPVGTIRADFSQGVWQLSWTVAPKERGCGIAKQMVALLAKQIDEPICAEIKIENKPSARIAEHAGMVFDHESEGIAYYQRASRSSSISS